MPRPLQVQQCLDFVTPQLHTEAATDHKPGKSVTQWMSLTYVLL